MCTLHTPPVHPAIMRTCIIRIYTHNRLNTIIIILTTNKKNVYGILTFFFGKMIVGAEDKFESLTGTSNSMCASPPPPSPETLTAF